MSIGETIRNIFSKPGIIERRQLDRMRSLPQDQARAEAGRILYEHCLQRTSSFAQQELKRGDSPYGGVQPAIFFHEMLAVTFWLLDQNAGGGNGELLKELHNNYFRSYSSADSEEERRECLARKYAGYEDTWNEITGHLDEFGLLVVQNIFGKEENSRTRERTFWIIQYADEAVKAFSPLQKVLKKIVKQAVMQ
jgi:hypothetical protein